jgi:group I intron endonuclease
MEVEMSLKESGIYCIENAWNEKRYIGSSSNVQLRIKRHIRMLKNGAHHSIKLQAAWNKYGEEAFEAGMMLRCPVEELIEMEQAMIFAFDAVDNGYNVAAKAGSPMSGRKHSDKTLERMSESHKGRKPISEETRQAMRVSSKIREAEKKANGFVVSEETRVKLAAAGKGRAVSEETKEKIRKANSGRSLSEEHRQKLSDAHKGKPLSEAQIAGNVAGGLANTGKKRSEAFRQMASYLASNRSEEHQNKLNASLNNHYSKSVTGDENDKHSI